MVARVPLVLIAGEDHHSICVGDAVGNAFDIESGLLKFGAAVDLGRIQGPRTVASTDTEPEELKSRLKS